MVELSSGWGVARGYQIDGDYREVARLRDGTVVLLRMVQPSDRELLRRGFGRLSARSRYMRFLTQKAELADHELDELLALDGRERLAIGAQRIGPDGQEGEGVAIARFARLRDGVAEAAVTVADEVQGRGLGTLLLRRLVAAARERGIERFVCEFDADNVPVWRFVQAIAPGTEVVDRGFVRAEVSLSAVEDVVARDGPQGRGGRTAARTRPTRYAPARRTAAKGKKVV